MSIASEISRISGNVADAYTAANAKGATMPVSQNSDNLATTISTIPSGTTPTGTKSITANGVYDVTNFASADVQVPTTAPAYYIEKTVDANGKISNSAVLINLSGIKDVGKGVFSYQYTSAVFPANTSVNFSSLLGMTGQRACYYMFESCIGLTSVNMSSLTTISGDSVCYYMFSNCSGITSVDLSSLTAITGSNACNGMFRFCAGLTIVDLSSLTTIGASGCYGMFNNCTALTSVDLSSLTEITGSSGCFSMFQSCYALTSVDLSSLTAIKDASGLSGAFESCRNLTSLTFNSLKDVLGNACLTGLSRSSGILSIFFPALTSSSFGTRVNQFNNMLVSVTGCTIHLPSNLDPQSGSTVISSLTGYPNFGGTNTVLAFDLPATKHLIGADTVEYERSPKFDTGTALAWRVNNTAVTATTYYTSGTTNPVVNDTIYSDFACTQAVTTISSII